jgi:hypothetical protein
MMAKDKIARAGRMPFIDMRRHRELDEITSGWAAVK